MLDRVKNSLCIFALIVFSVGFMKGVAFQEWPGFLFNVSILGFGLIWSFGQIMLQKIQIKSFLVNMVVDFLLSFTVLLVYGYICGWYSGLNDVWYLCAEAVMVYAGAYFLGVHRIRREVNIINKKLMERKRTEA